jgi:hypothetical protein
MTNLQIVLNILIILLLIYISLRLIYNQHKLPLIQHIEESLTILNNPDTELADLISNSDNSFINNIQSISKDSATLQLREYCIKASYNSASTGNYVNIDMIKHLLKRGCRLLDFEIFYIKVDDKFTPVVGFTTDKHYNIIESKNTIKLDDVLIMIATNAFTDTSPNRNDPIFINLRIKSNDSGIYNAVAKSINNNIKSSVYNSKVSDDTILSELLSKTVIMVDKTIKRDYKTLATCDNTSLDCFDLNNYINIESGSESVNLFKLSNLIGQAYTPILIKDDNIRTTVKNIRMAIPDTVNLSNNPIITDYIIKYGCQLVAYMFYIRDTNIDEYEEFFNYNTTAFVPLSTAITYFTNKSQI